MISSIDLVNFKIHKRLNLNIDNKNVAIVGPNASGKTTILESIYYGFITKPLFGNQLNLINRNDSYMKLNIIYKLDKQSNLEYRLENRPKSVSRKITINGVKKKPQEVVGSMPVIFFNAEDTRIINDSPSYRRNFINNTIIQSSREYLNALMTFNKILMQRNKLLYSIKNNTSSSKDQLFVYNLQISEPISIIYKHIDNLVTEINQKLSSYYSKISKDKDVITSAYLNSLPKEKDDIFKYLEKSTNDDLLKGFTTKGPHKDDLVIKVNGYDARNGLSRGEIRSLVLAIKMLEADFIKDSTAISPILLLDDVMSELDSTRRKNLTESIDAEQTIITTTELDSNMSNFEVLTI